MKLRPIQEQLEANQAFLEHPDCTESLVPNIDYYKNIVFTLQGTVRDKDDGEVWEGKYQQQFPNICIRQLQFNGFFGIFYFHISNLL